MTQFKLALKNIGRKRGRSIAIILAAALAAGLLFGSTAVLTSVGKSLQNGIDKFGADIMVLPAGSQEIGRRVLLTATPSVFYMDGNVLERVKAVKGIEKASPQLFVMPAKLQCCHAIDVLLVGYDPDTDFSITPWISYTYKPWPSVANRDPVLLGRSLNYLSHNDMLFYGKKFRIGSILAPTGLAFVDGSVFMSMKVIRSMIAESKTKSLKPLAIGPDQISSVLVKVDRDADIGKVASDIEAAVPGVKVLMTKDVVVAARHGVQAALWGVIVTTVACWLLMLGLMGLVFAMTVNERERELGILRAMGATRVVVFKLLLTEASLLLAIGAFAGVGLSLSVILNFKKAIYMALGDIQFLWPSPVLFIGLGAACVLVILVSGAACAALPAVISCRKEPYEAICSAVR